MCVYTCTTSSLLSSVSTNRLLLLPVGPINVWNIKLSIFIE